MLQREKMGLLLQIRTQDFSLSISLHSLLLFLFLHFVAVARILILEVKHRNKQQTCCYFLFCNRFPMWASHIQSDSAALAYTVVVIHMSNSININRAACAHKNYLHKGYKTMPIILLYHCFLGSCCSRSMATLNVSNFQ